MGIEYKISRGGTLSYSLPRAVVPDNEGEGSVESNGLPGDGAEGSDTQDRKLLDFGHIDSSGSWSISETSASSAPTICGSLGRWLGFQAAATLTIKKASKRNSEAQAGHAIFRALDAFQWEGPHSGCLIIPLVVFYSGSLLQG